MLHKISWESGNQIWAKNCTLQFSARNREIFRMYSEDFGAGEFQYAIRIFNGANEVAMATKFEQKPDKIALI